MKKLTIKPQEQKQFRGAADLDSGDWFIDQEGDIMLRLHGIQVVRIQDGFKFDCVAVKVKELIEKPEFEITDA